MRRSYIAVSYTHLDVYKRQILNYERCLLLDPGDSDARFNLQMARQKTIDKIEPVGDFFLVKWFKSVENLGSADSWAKTGIVCFLLFIGCLILFFFSRWVRLKLSLIHI